MTQPPDPLHLVERAARRLLETDDHPASQLLRRRATVPAAPRPAPVPVALPVPAAPLADPLADRLADAVADAPAPPAILAPGQPAPSGPEPLDDRALKSAGMIDWGHTRARLSEEFRIVQSQVNQALATVVVKPPALANLLMLTSAKPGEGKTFSSLNLAGSLASSNPQQVILVDVDLKRHSLTTRLRLRERPGLLDIAFDPAVTFGDALIGTSLPNLRILPIGRNETQAALSGDKPLIKILQRLGRAYADCLIVLDTPPCLSSSEPSTLASIVGGVVMLIEAQQTQRAEVETALGLVEAAPMALLMLNKVQLTGSGSFGSYGY